MHSIQPKVATYLREVTVRNANLQKAAFHVIASKTLLLYTGKDKEGIRSRAYGVIKAER